MVTDMIGKVLAATVRHRHAQTTSAVDRLSTLRMAFAEPQLVRRRGIPWSRNALRTDNVDARFLAAAIRHYVCHPEHRAAIGSHEGYQRLLAELPGRHGGKESDDNL